MSRLDELHLSWANVVFDPAKHPRGLAGHFARTEWHVTTALQHVEAAKDQKYGTRFHTERAIDKAMNNIPESHPVHKSLVAARDALHAGSLPQTEHHLRATLNQVQQQRREQFFGDSAPRLTPIPPVGLPDQAMNAGATNHPFQSIWHGDKHWRCVAKTGLELCKRTPNSDPGFVLTFAMLHDTMRENEYEDELHGDRAAEMYQKLFGDKADPDLIYALVGHNGVPDATDHPNPSVGICWDADRLNLPRVGVQATDRYLSTPAARTTEMKDIGRQLSHRQMTGRSLPTWYQLHQEAQAIRRDRIAGKI